MYGIPCPILQATRVRPAKSHGETPDPCSHPCALRGPCYIQAAPLNSLGELSTHIVFCFLSKREKNRCAISISYPESEPHSSCCCSVSSVHPWQPGRLTAGTHGTQPPPPKLRGRSRATEGLGRPRKFGIVISRPECLGSTWTPLLFSTLTNYVVHSLLGNCSTP